MLRGAVFTVEVVDQLGGVVVEMIHILGVGFRRALAYVNKFESVD